MTKATPKPAFVTNNQLLSALSPADRDLLIPQLEGVSLELRHVLEKAQKPISHVYFLEGGIASVVANGRGEREVEVGIIGREGMTGTSVILGADYPTNDTYMQVAGRGQRIDARHLRNAIGRSLSLQQFLLKYVHVFMTHVARTAFANGRESIEARLARWLLMAQDRLDGNEVPLTHELLAIMLGTTRPGVTVVLQSLERKRLVSLHRKRIVIEDRAALRAAADKSYGIAEAELRRLTSGR
jgi:CRP-like cAMP-binding protein